MLCRLHGCCALSGELDTRAFQHAQSKYHGKHAFNEHLVGLPCRRRVHSFLTRIQRSSLLSSNNADEARSAILSFFDAPSGYTVVFTANASGALKLIGESFPFAPDSSYVLGADSHNSVHGIRQYAAEKNAQVSYIPATPQGGFYLDVAKVRLLSTSYLFLVID